MPRSPAPLLALLVASTVLGACASRTTSPPPSSTGTLTFETEADLDAWIAYGGDWSVEDGHAVGRSLYPESNRYSWLTCRDAYGDIERVVIRGGLDAAAPCNLRIGVGAVTVILNWEMGDLNLVHYIGSDARRAGPRALTPGQESEIVVEASGDGATRHVRLVVDDRIIWEDTGPPLMGTVTIYPALGSTIRVRDVEITGRRAPDIHVQGPSLPHY